MENIVEEFGEGRKILRRISLSQMEDTWEECSKRYGEEWTIRNEKKIWIEAIKKPNWSINTIWDETEGNWIEFEDWLDCNI